MNEQDAAYAVMGRLPLIGSGYYRNVYLSGDYVYKVTDNMEDGDINLDELETIKSIDQSTLPDNIRIPACRLFSFNGKTVMAMEYIKGEAMAECYCAPSEPHLSSCLPGNVYEAILKTGLYDLSLGNVIRKDNVYYIVDCQY